MLCCLPSQYDQWPFFFSFFFLVGVGQAGGVCSEGQIWSKERDSFLWEMTLVLDHRIWVG